MWKKLTASALAGGLLLLAGAGCGSNPIVLLAYLLNNNDPKLPAEFELKPRLKREKEEVRVVVLASNLPSVSPDMIGIDRLMAMEFVSLLEKRCHENKQRVVVLKSQPVEAYKRDHPNWRRENPYDIGEHFKADYVIDVEVLDVSLFDPGSRELMKGRARVSVTAYDLTKASKEPAFNPPEYNFEFPRTHEVPVHDMSVTTFRQRFIKHMANELVLPFTAHTSNQRVNLD